MDGVDRGDIFAGEASDPAHELTANQRKAMRLVALVRRRLPDQLEMDQIRERGDNYPLFRLSFLLSDLSGDSRVLVERQFSTFARKHANGRQASQIAHELEVVRLGLHEVQHRIDDLHAAIIELLRHAEKVNAALRQYGILQNTLMELRRQLEICAAQHRGK